jgi:hypothetical protein
MEKYEMPKVEFITLDREDVISTSQGCEIDGFPGGDYPDGAGSE